MADGPDYLLRIRPLASDTPAVIRLRAALKTLLRAYQLRCVEVSGLPAGTPTPAPDGQSSAGQGSGPAEAQAEAEQKLLAVEVPPGVGG
jgi:hypothetical protein